MIIYQQLSFLQAGCPSCRPTNSVKALKARALKASSLVMMNLLVLGYDTTAKWGVLVTWLALSLVACTAYCIGKSRSSTHAGCAITDLQQTVDNYMQF